MMWGCLGTSRDVSGVDVVFLGTFRGASGLLRNLLRDSRYDLTAAEEKSKPKHSVLL